MQAALAAVAAAYEGVEDPSTFAGPAAVARYRAGLLERSAEQVDALMAHLPDGAEILEVGCGNGRLLIELARRSAIVGGLGLDVAASRIAFARAWAADAGLNLRFEAGDALAAEIPASAFDAAVCITGALGYFGAAEPRLDGALLRRLAASLRPGGMVCLELYPHPNERRLLEATGGTAQVWRELPHEDPWRFYLSELTLRDGVLTHRKTFIHRDDGRVDSGRTECLYLYTEREAEALVRDAGFCDVTCLDGWTAAPYAGGDVLVVLARTEA